MSIANLIEEIRLELTDEQSTRWDDDQLLKFVHKSVRRLNQVLARNEISFAQSVQAVKFMPDGTIGDFPKLHTILVVKGLFRDDNGAEVVHLLGPQWAQVVSASEMAVWSIINKEARYKAVVQGEPTGTLIYYPQVVIDQINSPWEGRLDDSIVEYAAFRAKNVDEMNLQQDKELMAEIEQRIIDNFKTLGPQQTLARGWTN
jgi:hypothetical protein